MKPNGYFWHFLTIVAFLFIYFLSIIFLISQNKLPYSISIFDFILIFIAVFRLIQLFVYDEVTDFIRDYFKKYEEGFGKSMSELLSCPWCVGIWLAFLIAFFYFLTSYSWYFIFILAVAGVASLIQLLADYLKKAKGVKTLEMKILKK